MYVFTVVTRPRNALTKYSADKKGNYNETKRGIVCVPARYARYASDAIE